MTTEGILILVLAVINISLIISVLKLQDDISRIDENIVTLHDHLLRYRDGMCDVEKRLDTIEGSTEDDTIYEE